MGSEECTLCSGKLKCEYDHFERFKLPTPAGYESCFGDFEKYRNPDRSESLEDHPCNNCPHEDNCIRQQNLDPKTPDRRTWDGYNPPGCKLVKIKTAEGHEIKVFQNPEWELGKPIPLGVSGIDKIPTYFIPKRVPNTNKIIETSDRNKVIEALKKHRSEVLGVSQ